MTVRLTLPWPPADLSPNARGSWQARHRAARAYRMTCGLHTLTQRKASWRIPDGPLRLRLIFAAPSRSANRERHDRDNLLARMKAGLDGVCDVLQFDDSRFAEVAVRMGAPIAGGEVRLEITKDVDA